MYNSPDVHSPLAVRLWPWPLVGVRPGSVIRVEVNERIGRRQVAETEVQSRVKKRQPQQRVRTAKGDEPSGSDIIHVHQRCHSFLGNGLPGPLLVSCTSCTQQPLGGKTQMTRMSGVASASPLAVVIQKPGAPTPASVEAGEHPLGTERIHSGRKPSLSARNIQRGGRLVKQQHGGKLIASWKSMHLQMSRVATCSAECPRSYPVRGVSMDDGIMVVRSRIRGREDEKQSKRKM